MAFVNNYEDFIQYHAAKACMTREEFMAVLMSEDAKKPGPDPYHRGLDDEEVEDKEDQIKKQAEMDDDDPEAYKEMPGDEEAREKGEVKTSKHVKSYHELYGDEDEKNEAVDTYYLDNAKSRLKNVYKHLDVEYGETRRGDKYVQIHYIPVTRPQSQNPEWVKVFYDNDVDLKKISKELGMDLKESVLNEEMPGDEEARDKGEVKTSKHTKAYDKLYSEGVMSDIHQMAADVKDEAEFIAKFFKQYGAKIKKTKDSEEWAKSLYNDMNESEQSDQMAYAQLERIIDYATMIRQRMDAGKQLDDWMYGKVVKAEDYLNTLYDVIDGDDGVIETQKMTNKEWKKIKKFNKHVTDSGEKFVMSYDDRIGTFLEPVEIIEEKAEGDRGPIADDAIETALKKKSDETGVPIDIIRVVMRRGMAAWKSGHRPGANQQQWGYARVNSFLTKQEGTWGNADADLAKEVRDGGHDKNLKKA